jgi:hypothetical protein
MESDSSGSGEGWRVGTIEMVCEKTNSYSFSNPVNHAHTDCNNAGTTKKGYVFSDQPLYIPEYMGRISQVQTS